MKIIKKTTVNDYDGNIYVKRDFLKIAFKLSLKKNLRREQLTQF